ncbi:MAG: alkaline phosphatase family protein [Sciscionella sp.]
MHDPATDSASCTGKRVTLGGQDRCGHGPRLPMLLISPYARKNYVDHAVTAQTSIISFIENNWLLR